MPKNEENGLKMVFFAFFSTDFVIRFSFNLKWKVIFLYLFHHKTIICQNSGSHVMDQNALANQIAGFFKVCVHYICAILYLSLNESTCQTRKMCFSSLQKLFSLSKKSNFRILHFQISWHHQMLKHKTRNTFHWITWELNTVC